MVLSSLLVFAFTFVSSDLSPYLCSDNNIDFDNFRSYPADNQQFAHCKRNVSSSVKAKIYEEYGIADHSAYCVDHALSLFAGGNNEMDNLWPNLKDSNGQCEKQGLETEVLSKLQKGEITTNEAQNLLINYVSQRKQELYSK